MTFPRYPDYKDSGIEWLGEVPGHWDLCALKRIATLRSGETINSDSIDETGDYPVYGGNGFRGFTENFTHEGFYPLIGRQGALCGNVNYADGRFWASEHAVVVSPIKDVARKWLGELLRAMNLNQYSVSAAQPGLSVDIISNLFIPVPPLPEQSAIAAFLDRETGKIDALVAEQEKLIELLKEKRQAVISRAVTKGLDPSVPMKDSGIEWLGEVPAHWQVVPLRALSSVVRGASPRPAGDPRFFGGDFMPWVTVAEITKDDLVDLNETTDFLTEEGAEFSRVFPAGTVIYSNSGATLGVPKILKIAACANDGVVGFLSLIDRMDSGFVCHFLGSLTEIIRDEIRQGSGQPNLNTDIVKAIRMPVPPLDEQLAVVDCIRDVCKRFARITAEAQRAIDFLKEHRSALISAAVTGKIDVRGLVPAPEEAA